MQPPWQIDIDVDSMVLGLPKEPDVSRDVPFRDLKKGIQEQEARSL